ncbi:MAG: tRNA (adenosine(37)-N6)-threonylcarbamoyltransferase complex ATPase subunit type 1 TsaE [Planctomycetes bacterium]|nr:tRNA (adenosine(37)-N6)-threonylcarbamoyltransferase complex ATPase subunit type 1 TsaE [Planctomycetota bacterium]
MTTFTFRAETLHDTDHLAAALAAALPERAVVALSGTLGAGKTQLVRALAAACGVPAEEVVSPTFVLCQEYRGRRMLYHFDAYRIRDDDEFLELGPEEYFESPGVTLIEWAERVARCLPEDRLEIHIEPTGETSRTFQIAAHGAGMDGVVAEVQRRLERR